MDRTIDAPLAMRKVVAVLLGLSAPLLFPAAFALGVVVITSVIVPPIGLLAGMLTDALYYTPSVSIPYATIIGLVISVLGYFVQRFLKTRIMTA